MEFLIEYVAENGPQRVATSSRAWAEQNVLLLMDLGVEFTFTTKK
jgi:hypothetical protein